MATIRIALANILAALSALVAAGNIIDVAAAYRNRWRGINRNYSCVPFFSLILGLLGWWAGHERLGLWPMLPAVIDPATWMLAWLPGWLTWHWFKDKGNPPN